MTGRHHQAWALSRRVGRQRSLDPKPVHWAALGSIWLHLAVIGVGLLDPGPPPAAPREEQVLIVVRADPGIPRSGAIVPAEPDAAVAPTIRVARTELEDRSRAPPDRWDAESLYDSESPDARRAPIASDRPGPLVAPSEGAGDEQGGRTLERRAGDVLARSGNRPDGPDGPIVLGGGGGGREGSGTARGAPTPGGEGSEAGAAGGRGGAPVPAWARSERPTPDGPDPASRTAAPAWWDPIAARIESAPGSGGIAIPGIARGSGRAEHDRVGARSSTGGQDAPLDGPALPGVGDEHPGTRRVAAPGTADPADELRLALGFGPLDRSKLAPRPAWAGTLFGQGRADSSPQTALDVPIDWRTALSTRGTVLGAWVQEAEAIVGERWRTMDLDPHARAIGISGDVTVRYEVRRDGSVEDVRLVRSSGNGTLDGMAVLAIPPRLPRFPRELVESAIQQDLTLHYRNPLVTIAPR